MIPVPTLSPLTWIKIIGGLAIVIALAVLVMDRNKWKGRAERYNGEAVSMYEATKLASGNPKLERKDTARQIGEFGKTVTTLKDSLARQNAAIEAAAQKTADQQEDAATALQRAAQRVEKAKAASERLTASARADGPQAGCEPSEALKEAWR